MIIYGGSKKTVQKQLDCEHDWYGPCMDYIARYLKCKNCYCIDYDIGSEEAYYDAVREHENGREISEINRGILRQRAGETNS